MIKAAFPISLQGVKHATEHVGIIISAGERRVPFHVRLMPCPITSNPAMMFVYLESPPATGNSQAFKELNDEQRLWVRVLSVFEARLQNDIAHIPRATHDQLVRIWGLAYLALAFDQRGWIVERRQVTFKMAAASRYAPIGEENVNGHQAGQRKVDLTPEKLRAGVEEYIGGNLAGELLGVNGAQWASYLEFERSLLNHIFKIIKEYRAFNDRLDKIHNYCETIRKTAGDTERLFLRLLQSCADSALGDIYAFTSSAVLDDLEASLTNSLLRGRLARADIAANRYLHTPREELGGALLALHPIGSVILDSRKAIELLMAHVLNPGDLDARDRFNAILIIATRMYSELVGEQLSDEVTTESDCRDSDKPDNPTPIDLARSAIESPDVEAASNEMHEWIRKALDQDEELQRDKPVFMDRAFHGLSGAEVAKIHGISAGEVSKRTAAVQKRLKALAIRRGFLPGDD